MASIQLISFDRSVAPLRGGIPQQAKRKTIGRILLLISNLIIK